MKKKSLKTLASLSLLGFLSACAKGPDVPLDSSLYVKELEKSHTSFNILQLTDLHFNFNTIVDESLSYLDKVVAKAKAEADDHIDLIIVTGDSFLVANKHLVDRLYDHIDGYGISTAITYGNHDKQGTWSTDWMNKKVSSGKNSITTIVPDNIMGDTNYVINIKEGAKNLWQIFLIDSNSYANNGPFYKYDCIHEDQVAWMKAQSQKMTNDNGGVTVPSLGFFHIPPLEFVDHAKEENLVMGENHEKFAVAKIASSFVKEAKAIGMKGAFFGHDHSNDSVYAKDGFVLGYGVKANPELYYYKDETGFTHTGAAIYRLKDSGSYTIKHIYMDYINHSLTKTLEWEAL